MQHSKKGKIIEMENRFLGTRGKKFRYHADLDDGIVLYLDCGGNYMNLHLP